MTEMSGAMGRMPEGYVGSGRNGTLSREEAQRLLEEWAASGKKLVEFSREKGLSDSRLGWWRSRFARESRQRGGAVPSSGFVPVVTASKGRDGNRPLELVLKTGQVVRVPSDFDEGALRRLVLALEGMVQPC